MTSMSEENLKLGAQNRQFQQEQLRMQKDLKQIMAINNEFQMQSASFRDKEAQFVDLGREYREKLEILKFERERLALKEEQFVRVLHKAESDAKQDVKKM